MQSSSHHISSPAGQATSCDQTDATSRTKIDLAAEIKRSAGAQTNYETHLERLGDINTLQRLRYQAWCKTLTGRDPGYFLLCVEEAMREIVQAELDTQESPPVLETEAQKRLQDLDSEWSFLYIRWWRYRSRMSPPQSRAFMTWRAHPKWYMHRALIEDCVARGGCCARGCGCCHGRKIDESRKFGAGHCTSECACCQKERPPVFKRTTLLNDEQMEGLEERRRRLKRIKRVSIWGFDGDAQYNPFDMIDLPSSCIEIPREALQGLSQRRKPAPRQLTSVGALAGDNQYSPIGIIDSPPSYEEIEEDDRNGLLGWLQKMRRRFQLAN